MFSHKNLRIPDYPVTVVNVKKNYSEKGEYVYMNVNRVFKISRTGA